MIRERGIAHQRLRGLGRKVRVGVGGLVEHLGIVREVAQQGQQKFLGIQRLVADHGAAQAVQPGKFLYVGVCDAADGFSQFWDSLSAMAGRR